MRDQQPRGESQPWIWARVPRRGSGGGSPGQGSPAWIWARVPRARVPGLDLEEGPQGEGPLPGSGGGSPGRGSSAWIWARVPGAPIWRRVPSLDLGKGPRPRFWTRVSGPGSGRGSSRSISPADHGPGEASTPCAPRPFCEAAQTRGRRAPPPPQGLGQGSAPRSRRAPAPRPKAPDWPLSKLSRAPGCPHEAVSHTLPLTPRGPSVLKKTDFLQGAFLNSSAGPQTPVGESPKPFLKDWFFLR